MNVITLVDPAVMGVRHPTYGFSVWSATDSDFPVMFNIMDGTEEEAAKRLLPNVRVTYDTAELKTSTKGIKYLRLKKVKFEDNPVKKEDVVPFTEKPAPTFNKEASKAFLKDLSDYPVRVYNGSLNYAKEAGLNLIGNSEDRREYLEYVQDVTNELLVWSDKIRSGQGANESNVSAVQASSPSVKEPQAAAGSLKSAWEERKNLPKAVSWNEEEPPHGDEEVPHEV